MHELPTPHDVLVCENTVVTACVRRSVVFLRSQEPSPIASLTHKYEERILRSNLNDFCQHDERRSE